MIDYYFWFVAMSAVFIVGLAKSGLLGSVGLVGVPMLTLIMSPREAAGMMLPVLLVMDGFAVYAYRHEVDWKNLKVILPGAMIGISFGWAMSSFVTDDMVLLFVGLIAMTFILDAVLPIRKKLANRIPSKPWGVFWGSLAGFTSFVSHTGGPPYQVYVLPQKLKPALYAGTTAWCFAILNAVKLVPYYFLGQLSAGSLRLSASLIPVAICGVVLGIFLVRRISAELFYKIAYSLVFLLSLKLIYDGIRGVFFGL